ncbi:MAG TPA: glycosyl hydrolase family 65 protein [Verrucomicrobiae bacterium]
MDKNVRAPGGLVIARRARKPGLVAEFNAKAAPLRRLTQARLWDGNAEFFKVRLETGSLSDAREAVGFIPWMFDLPEAGKGYEAAWAQLADPQGFASPFDLTTAERRHPQFRSHGVGTCESEGAVWPFATSQMFSALKLVPRDYFSTFLTCVRSRHADGNPYIGEYLDEVTGDWINGKDGRRRYCNHSTFAGLLITGVLGLRSHADDTVEVHPLLPPETWDWCCLDGVKDHGRLLTVLWDKDRRRYGRVSGLQVLTAGKEIARADSLHPAFGKLP